MRPTGVFFFLLCFSVAQGQTVTQTELHSLPQPAGPEPGLTIAYMLQAADGNFYGFSDDPGLFFRFTTSGSYSLIASPSNPTFGINMIQGPDGKFYGPSADGTGIVRMTTAGQVTTYAFPFDYQSEQYTDGSDAVGLTLGSDGNYYGVATQGGLASTHGGESPGYGTIFKMTPDGVFNLLYSFTGGADDGGFPVQPLVQASDGNFYGTTSIGGSGIGGSGCNELGCGTVFRITPEGKFTTLYKFGSGQNTTDGYSPLAAMVEAGDGDLYGIHQYATDVPYAQDALYQINPSGQYNVVYSAASGNVGNGLGYSLDLGSDGDLYMDNYASVIQASSSGVVTYYSDPDYAESPFSFQILQGSDGNFYGAYGYIGQLSQTPPLPAPVQVSLSSNTVMPGAKVTASLKVLNAFSLTMQQCYAFQTLNGETTPLGKVPGTFSTDTKLYTFSTTFAPTLAGTYNYAVTCGGVEAVMRACR